MAPKKGRVRRLPRNTVTLVIDGTEEEVLKNFRACQAYFRYWNFCTGAFRVRIGNRVIYTTPLRGTFYYVVRYRGRNLVFVIVGRQYWLIGFFGENGFYQMLFEGQGTIYMNSTKGTTVTPFSANHSDISHKGVENTRLDIHAVRGGFDSIHSYRGPRHALPEGFPAAIGRFTVLIMETKFKDIHNRCEEALVGYENTRLGEVLKDLVINWSTLCKIVMNAIMKRYHMAEELAEIRSLLSQILIYQVDAVFTGLFAHEPLPPEPRTEVWDPIDEEYIDGGKADSQVPNFDTPPSPAAPRYTAKRGVKRGFSQINQPGEKMARKGLRGGGAGGLPIVPQWFASWNQENEDKKECDLLVAGARELGLLIVEVDPLLLSKNKENQSDQGGKVTKNISNSDVVDLQNNSFLSDTVITKYFRQLSAMLDSDEVLLVEAAVAVAYARDPTTISAELLRDRRIVVLPVNNATEFGRPDLGSHWSVLIIDATSEGSPRFIHHDSSDGLNLPAAQKLAERMRTIFPAAQEVEDVQTPRQKNGHDCAVYVMAIANSITSWWTRREFEENWMDRMWNEVTTEKVRTMRQKLAELLENEELEKETKKVASDVADLRNNSFLSDDVISNYFSQLSAMSGSDEVLLVDAASAVAYAQDPTSINPEHLRNQRIVVLPVNNTTEFGRPDRGSHWSVLIIDATSEGSPRFIHHDSSDGLNLLAAQQLAERMRAIFPAAQEVENVQTPRQQNGYDCAMYVMAIARSITKWWARRESEKDWMDIMWNEVTAEKVCTMRQQLADFLEKEELEKETKKAECKKEKTKEDS